MLKSSGPYTHEQASLMADDRDGDEDEGLRGLGEPVGWDWPEIARQVLARGDPGSLSQGGRQLEMGGKGLGTCCSETCSERFPWTAGEARACLCSKPAGLGDPSPHCSTRALLPFWGS